MQAILATDSDNYRKPNTGAWSFFLEILNSGAEGEVDMKESFYCGDAAGRKTKLNKDFADSD